MKLTVFSLVTLLGAQAALADYAAVDVPAENVSTLNGQLVPVGEQNRYQYSHPEWNVSTNPIGLVLGLYGASVQYAPHNVFSLRADVNYYDPVGGGDASGFEVGLSAPIYFAKMYSGFYLEPGVAYRRFSENSEDFSHVGPQVLVGWHWFWDSGMNVSAAFGVQRNFSEKDDDDKVLPNGYLRIGYAF